jgi:hypothetical protein
MPAIPPAQLDPSSLFLPNERIHLVQSYLLVSLLVFLLLILVFLTEKACTALTRYKGRQGTESASLLFNRVEARRQTPKEAALAREYEQRQRSEALACAQWGSFI